MTFVELTAAMWDQREIQVRNWDGLLIRCVPKGVERCVNDDGSVEWKVLYDTLTGGRMACLYTIIDAFDGHSGETT